MRNRSVVRVLLCVLAACLLAGLLAPRAVRAGGDMGEAPYDIGEKLFAKSQYKTALRYYRKALARNDLPEVQRSEATQRIATIEERLKQASPSRRLLEQGKGLLGKRKYRDAVKVLLQAAAKDKSDAEIHYFLGEAYLGLEDYARATAEYKKAKKLSGK